MHQQELGVAALRYTYTDVHRDPKKSAAIDIEEFFFHKPKEKKQINSAIANTIYKLVKDAIVPEWLFDCLPRREIFAYRRGRQTLRPRLWLDCEGEEVAIFCPTLPSEEGIITAGVAVITGGVSGERLVRDVDTNQVYLIKIPPQDEEDICLYNAVFQLG